MPELPEVQTVISDLQQKLLGKKLISLHSSCPRIFRESKHKSRKISQLIHNKKINSITRLAKYILIQLDNQAILVIHLGMSGTFIYQPRLQTPPRHTRATFQLNDHSQLYYLDPRTFGSIIYFENKTKLQHSPKFSKLGLDPLSPDFKKKNFHDIFGNTKKNIKSALLDQDKLAGLGNIYSDEACFLAGIHPARAVSSITPSEARKLWITIPKILKASIRARGSSISDFYDTDGKSGNNQKKLYVYGRSGQACKICQQKIQHQTLGGRTSCYCPHCQK